MKQLATRLIPLRFVPIFKRAIWGGRRLATLLYKQLPPGDDYAESWEIADHGADVGIVADGPFAGCSLHDLVLEFGAHLTGKKYDAFPLLIKFLDANQRLSVQVHPNDRLAREMANDRGKTEAWLILHADPGSVIYAGLKQGVTRKVFEKAIHSGDIEACLHRAPVKPGDCIYIPAGTVHAIGAGIVLAEVQQMSDTTYRVYDWGRAGSDGRRRKLHIDQAMKCIDFTRGPVNPQIPERVEVEGGIAETLVESEYFVIRRRSLDGLGKIGSPTRFTILLGIDGDCTIADNGLEYRLGVGQSILLPAQIGECPLRPLTSKAAILECSVP